MKNVCLSSIPFFSLGIAMENYFSRSGEGYRSYLTMLPFGPIICAALTYLLIPQWRSCFRTLHWQTWQKLSEKKTFSHENSKQRVLVIFKTKQDKSLINRPLVPRAVLQTPLSLINSVSQWSFLEISPEPLHSQTLRARERKFWKMVHLACVTCNVWCVMYHVSHVMCHMSCVTCNV